jgi:hypothetical protein
MISSSILPLSLSRGAAAIADAADHDGNDDSMVGINFVLLVELCLQNDDIMKFCSSSLSLFLLT